MFAYVGGYTTADRDGRGDGIHVYRIDAQSGAWTHVQHVDGLANPSLFTLRGDRRVSVFRAWRPRSSVSAFTIDPESGRLRLLSQMPCQGNNPVDAALDSGSTPSGRCQLRQRQRGGIAAGAGRAAAAGAPALPTAGQAGTGSGAADVVASARRDLRSDRRLRHRAGQRLRLHLRVSLRRRRRAASNRRRRDRWRRVRAPRRGIACSIRRCRCCTSTTSWTPPSPSMAGTARPAR